MEYKTVSELVKIANFESQTDKINWLLANRETAAATIAKLYLLSHMAINSNPAVDKNIKKLYKEVKDTVHPFAQEEAKSHLGLEEKDVQRIFQVSKKPAPTSFRKI